MTRTESATSPSRRTLHRGLAVLILLTSLLLSSVQAIFLMFAVKEESYRAAAVSAMGLVDHFAELLKPSLEADPVVVGALDATARELDYALPGASLYLVDQHGEVLTAAGLSAVIRHRIDPEPIKQFLRLPRQSFEPLLIEDPMERDGRAVFVAAAVTLAGVEHYLVMTLSRTAWLSAFRFTFDEKLFYFIVGTVALQLIVGSMFAFLFYRILTLRIRNLLGVLKRFTSGDYSARASVRGSTELSELAAQTNTMAETIERTVAQLADRDKRRRELIADVTHDLRAPTTVIRSNAEQIMALSTNDRSAESKSLSDSLIKSSDSLGRLLGQLWELSRLETRDRPLNVDRFPLSELTSEIAESYRTLAIEKGVQLLVETTEDPTPVIADSDLITRAISNLIENAITYTPGGGTVTVTTHVIEHGVQVTVMDSGVGIPESDIERIFERSYRVEKWRHRREDSSGLGLAIVRSILEAHGSEIKVDSREREGSTFYFRLPIAPPSAMAAAQR